MSYKDGIESNRTLLSREEISWAYQKWCEGHELWRIADALNVSYKTVHRALAGREKINIPLVYKVSEKGG